MSPLRASFGGSMSTASLPLCPATRFSCRFQWREGSLTFWDNRSTWHFAVNDYHGERRLLHRITIEGVPLSS